MKIFIVEDQLFDLEDILISLKATDHEVLGHSDDPFETIEKVKELQPDVVLVDIHLKGKKAGVSLAQQLQDQFQTQIIFTTSETSSETISNAAAIHPIAYLTKPIHENDLKAALIIAESKLESMTSESAIPIEELFIKHGNKLVKVLLDTILFAHTDTKNYCTIITEEGKKFSVRSSILGLHQLLNHDCFIQTHRSYIINWEKVAFVNEADQTIDVGGHTVPVGRTFKSGLYYKLNII